MSTRPSATRWLAALGAAAMGAAVAPPAMTASAESRGSVLYVDTSEGFPRGLFRADGAGRTLLSGDVDAVTPAWSPGADQVAFAGDHGTADAGLYVVTDDGAPDRIVDMTALYPAWSPDGTQIAFTGGRHVHIVAADGSGLRRVSSGTTDGDVYPRWSPDGSRLVFTRLGETEGGVATDTLMTVPAAGGEARVLVEGGSFARWSPSGEQIAFTSAGGLEVIGADGSGRRRLGAGPVRGRLVARRQPGRRRSRRRRGVRARHGRADAAHRGRPGR